MIANVHEYIGEDPTLDHPFMCVLCLIVVALRQIGDLYSRMAFSGYPGCYLQCERPKGLTLRNRPNPSNPRGDGNTG